MSAQRHPVVEFAKTRERGIAVNVLENEFTGMLAADARDVYCFYLGHVESHFRVFPTPVANLDEHLQGSFESALEFFLGAAFPACHNRGRLRQQLTPVIKRIRVRIRGT